MAKQNLSAAQAEQRKIIHCDCDCFFAAVETLDHPEWAGKPLAVGGTLQRGVVATANYEARKFGVHSALPSAQAMRLCPELILAPPNFERYREISLQIREIFARYTQAIQPASIDEAYLDVTDSDCCQGSATWIARDIRAAVHKEIGITISAGVAPNKFLAKIASDRQKPDGLTVIVPSEVSEVMRTLPVEKIPGVGRVTTGHMNSLGIKTAGDLQAFSSVELVMKFGRFGQRLSEVCHGHDNRPVQPPGPLKSVSVEQTFTSDLPNHDACQQALPGLLAKLAKRAHKHHIDLVDQPLETSEATHKCFVKVRFNDFTTTTLERSGQQFSLACFKYLLEMAWLRGKKPVRLLGVGIRLDKIDLQPDLF